jgi:hypothetical protein
MTCSCTVNIRKIDIEVEFLTLRIKMTVHIDRCIRYAQFVAAYMRICLSFSCKFSLTSKNNIYSFVTMVY